MKEGTQETAEVARAQRGRCGTGDGAIYSFTIICPHEQDKRGIQLPMFHQAASGSRSGGLAVAQEIADFSLFLSEAGGFPVYNSDEGALGELPPAVKCAANPNNIKP